MLADHVTDSAQAPPTLGSEQPITETTPDDAVGEDTVVEVEDGAVVVVFVLVVDGAVVVVVCVVPDVVFELVVDGTVVVVCTVPEVVFVLVVDGAVVVVVCAVVVTEEGSVIVTVF
jgi:hypothetical protein